MKRAFLTFVMAVMLTTSLAACTSAPADTNRAAGNGSRGMMDGNSARNGARGGDTMHNNGRYYANDNGDVFGDNDGIGDDIGRAAGDMMDGMGDAVQDMTR